MYGLHLRCGGGTSKVHGLHVRVEVLHDNAQVVVLSVHFSGCLQNETD